MKLVSLCLLVTFFSCSTPYRPQELSKQTVEKMEQDVMFDGNCPNGLCHKKKVRGDGKYRLDIENKVYFFSTQEALDEFKKDVPRNLKRAQKAWRNMPERR